MPAGDQPVRAGLSIARRSLPWLAVLGSAQLVLWVTVAGLSTRFSPGSAFAKRPLLPVIGLLAVAFVLYLISLALVWNLPCNQDQARIAARTVLFFAVLFRLPLWWSPAIQEDDYYRYLWDGRVMLAGVNPYRYSPAQVKAARDGGSTFPELERLANLSRCSPEIAEIFSRIDHRSVPTLYPPLSEAVFAIAALVTPEHAPVLAQARVLKAVLLLFDLATVGLVMGLLGNLGQPAGRALAYAWCPLVLKEFANTGHVDSIAVCLTTAMFWQLTRPRVRDGLEAST
ncbi:MAG: hypothetical protein KGS61_15885, partial [Verrucomicrobia bacterium]|nr:hypothetical protein [Verrucomicrobiota bacterium]